MAMSMIKQNMARKAEKALKEVLNKADSNLNGKVALSDFVIILEANGVEVSKKHLETKSLNTRSKPSYDLFHVWFRWTMMT